MRKLTIEQTQKIVDEIKQHKHDPEVAHSLEDALWRRVLLAVSRGHPDSQELAKTAVKTTRIRFSRWTA